MYPAPCPMTDLWSPGPWVEFVALIAAKLQVAKAICLQFSGKQVQAVSHWMSLNPQVFFFNKWVFASAPKLVQLVNWIQKARHLGLINFPVFPSFRTVCQCETMSKYDKKYVSTNIDEVSEATLCGREVDGFARAEASVLSSIWLVKVCSPVSALLSSRQSDPRKSFLAKGFVRQQRDYSVIFYERIQDNTS
jgi:hypothetical protein